MTTEAPPSSDVTPKDTPTPVPAPSAEAALSLQFDRAEFQQETPAIPTCAACRATITTEFFRVNGKPLCAPCRARIAVELDRSRARRTLARAAAYGTLAAFACSVAWYAIRKITGYEIGLVAVAVGFVIAKAVRRGSFGIGGRRYQILAVILTYVSISMSYAPLLVEGLARRAETHQAAPSKGSPNGDDPVGAGASTPSSRVGTEEASPPHARSDRGGSLGVAIFALLALALAAPFLGGVSNIMGIFIIGIALYEAWKLSAASKLAIEGPFARPVTPSVASARV